MTREEILKAYEEALEHTSRQYEKSLKDAKEWCLKKLKEVRQEEGTNENL